MNNFEELLDNAQNGDKDSMDKLLELYFPLIEKIVNSAGKGINKDEFRQYLMIKFVENTKKFKKF